MGLSKLSIDETILSFANDTVSIVKVGFNEKLVLCFVWNIRKTSSIRIGITCFADIYFLAKNNNILLIVLRITRMYLLTYLKF